MEVLLTVQLEELPEGGYLATSDDLPGLVAQGRTAVETVEIAQDVAAKLIELYREDGIELPATLKAMPGNAEVSIPVTSVERS